jgi:ankyrin repeat protein
VDHFFTTKKGDLEIRLNHLIEKSKRVTIASKHSHETILLFLSGLDDVKVDFSRLLNYIEVNKTGFKKILQKFDKKISPGSTATYLNDKTLTMAFMNESHLLALMDVIEATEAPLSLMHQNPIHSVYSSSYISASMLLAIEQDHAEELKCLISDSLLIDSDRHTRLNALLRKCAAFKATKCFRITVELGASVNEVDDINERSSVHHFAMKGNIEFLQIVIDLGADLEAQDILGRRAIHYASIYGFTSCVALLIQKGHVKTDICDHEGYTPLFYAVIYGYTDIVKLLLSTTSSTAHHEISTIHGNASYMVSLEDSNCHETLLALACCYGHGTIAELLIAAGANVNCADENGETPLHHCCRRGYINCVSLLLLKKAQLDMAEAYTQWTPIFHCATNGFVTCLQMLLDAHADPNVVDTNGWTPFDYAVFRGQRPAAAILKPLMQPPQPLPLAKMDKSALLYTINSQPEFLQKVERIYGHEYLKDTNMIRIRLTSTDNRTSFELVQLMDVSMLRSHLSLVIYHPHSPGLQHIIHLPMKEQQDTLVFHSQNLHDFSLNIDLVPQFKTSMVLARAIVLPALFAPLSGVIAVALVNSGLQTVGKVTFEFRVIRPFSHPRLGPLGKHMYWKSIKVRQKRWEECVLKGRLTNLPLILTLVDVKIIIR